MNRISFIPGVHAGGGDRWDDREPRRHPDPPPSRDEVHLPPLPHHPRRRRHPLRRHPPRRHPAIRPQHREPDVHPLLPLRLESLQEHLDDL